MKLFEFVDNTFKILNCTVLKIKYKKGRTKFYAFGLPLFEVKNKYDAIRADFEAHKTFDVSRWDSQIDEIVATYKNIGGCEPNPRRVAFLATKIYDMGGHTKWMRDMQKTLSSDYEETLFLTTTRTSLKAAPQALKYLASISKIKTFNQFSCSFEKNIREIYDAIVSFAPRALFVFIHTDDIVATAVLALLKRHTNIKIFFVNHATDFPFLAVSFADLILEETPSSAYVTQKLRKAKQTHIVGLISKPEEENPHFSAEEIAQTRLKMGIPQGAICTLSGAASRKFFESDGSTYLEMIKKMLEEHQNVWHVLISEFNEKETAICERIFKDSTVKNRLIRLPYQENYELFFKCADLFIDSFPMSSALTFIDLMRLRVPYIVKINTENAALSFHEYQAPDFPYMYETVAEFYEGIKKLLADDAARLAMVENNYRHYLTHYEPKAARTILQNILNCENLSELYDKLDPNLHYSLNFDNETENHKQEN